MKDRTVLVVGGGEFGSCIAGILKKNCSVHVWDVDPGKRSSMMGLDAMCNQSSVVFLCVCSWHAVDALESVKPFLQSDALIVSCVKGLLQNGRTVNETIATMFPGNQFAVFSGPTIAEDMCQGLPGVAAVGGTAAVFEAVREVFSNTNISVMHEPDMHSVVWASILKNIYSLFIGMVDGAQMYAGMEQQWSDLVYAEWNALSEKFKINQSVLGGIAGRQDFQATAMSPHSANRAFGHALSSCATPEKDCEGMHSLGALVSIFEHDHEPLPRLLAAMHEISLQPGAAGTILSKLL